MIIDATILPDNPTALKQMLVDSHQVITDLQHRFDRGTSILFEQIRQAESKPFLDDIVKWLKKNLPQAPPKRLLGKAVTYTLTQWHRLIGYIEDDILSMDNYMAKNSIRPFVVGRKNGLFSGTPEGARPTN